MGISDANLLLGVPVAGRSGLLGAPSYCKGAAPSRTKAPRLQSRHSLMNFGKSGLGFEGVLVTAKWHQCPMVAINCYFQWQFNTY